MTKDDLRFKKTDKAIRHAFLKLASEHTIEEITIKEITALSECNRNTFYLHYTDKFDLINQLCNTQLTLIKKALNELSVNTYSNRTEWYLDCAEKSLDIIETYRNFYFPILGQNKYPPFVAEFGNVIPQHILTVLKEQNASYPKYNELTSEYLSNGMVGVIRCWLLHPDKYTKAHILKEFESIIINIGTVIFE